MVRRWTLLLQESFRMALSALRTEKLRAFLSLSGIIIGIFTIIGVLAAVDSLRRDVRRNIDSLGSQLLFVSKWPWSGMDSGYPWWKYLSRPVPTWQEARELRLRLSTARHVLFWAEASGRAESGQQMLDNVRLQGITSGFAQVWQVRLASGRFLSEAEFQSGQPVTVIGDGVARKLFGGLNPLNRILQFRGRSLTVVGVLAPEGRIILGGFSDESLVVPYNFFRTVINTRHPDLFAQILVQPKEEVPLAAAREELQGAMRALRRLRPGAEEDFSINQTDMLMRQTASIFAVLNLVAAIIGGFSIFIGGFGVANILFVSVKERTRQIGIQKALGATPGFILSQFLLESVALSLAGCVLGLLLVALGVRIASSFLGFPMTLSMANVSLGVLISSLTGLVAGIWPARTAARLQPAEAMRS